MDNAKRASKHLDRVLRHIAIDPYQVADNALCSTPIYSANGGRIGQELLLSAGDPLIIADTSTRKVHVICVESEKIGRYPIETPLGCNSC